jgi:mRNA interferase HicA
MKRDELLRRIARMALRQGVAWRLERQGANHEVWRCGAVEVTVPRHREINEMTAVGICRSLEEALGEGWWQS